MCGFCLNTFQNLLNGKEIDLNKMESNGLNQTIMIAAHIKQKSRIICGSYAQMILD